MKEAEKKTRMRRRIRGRVEEWEDLKKKEIWKKNMRRKRRNWGRKGSCANEANHGAYKGCSTDEETGLAVHIGWNFSPPLPCPSPLARVQSFADSLTSDSVLAHIYKNTVKR
jgi:hypothetical protein